MDMIKLRKSSRTVDRSWATVYRFILHLLLYIASLSAGFRLSKEAQLVGVSTNGRFLVPDTVSRFVVHSVANLKNESSYEGMLLNLPNEKNDSTISLGIHAGVKSSRPHAGRHEILIRYWPHPDPLETIVAHHLLDLVQEEQRRIYKPTKELKQLLMITPTYVHVHQAAHLTSLIHNMRTTQVHLLWIVVEAGGVSNETTSLLSSSQLSYHHVGFKDPMPDSWKERVQFKRQMRVDGLRFIREHRLDGIVIFADEGNIYNFDFFYQVQTLEWVGTFSTGLLSLVEHGHSKSAQVFACNSSKRIVEVVHKDSTLTDKSIYWARYALNARMLRDKYDKPAWIKNWDALFEGNTLLLESPLDFVTDASHIEVLGNCKEDIFVWHFHEEIHFNNDFPSRTPWPGVAIHSEQPTPTPPVLVLPRDGQKSSWIIMEGKL